MIFVLDIAIEIMRIPQKSFANIFKQDEFALIRPTLSLISLATAHNIIVD
jgi:hypothetical protein